jgi:hypothetical protein
MNSLTIESIVIIAKRVVFSKFWNKLYVKTKEAIKKIRE